MDTLSPEMSSPPRAIDSRPRAPSALSQESKRSRRSSGSGPKIDLTETSKDKKRLNTKADPSRALNEAQPATVALMEESNLDDLRSMTHKDFEGNLITDPDLSNPTRPRLERPLDTIRSFHMAAEGTDYRRRSTYTARPASQMSMSGVESRRTSYYGGPNSGPQQRSRLPGGYYRNSYYGYKPEGHTEHLQGPNPYQNRVMRNSSAPVPYSQYGEQTSPAHSHQISYETMTSGSDENNKSTNPSSQNSSMDQIHQARKPDDFWYENSNGINANHSPVSPYGSPSSFPHLQNGNYPRAPQAPPKDNFPRVPIKLDSGPIRAPEMDANSIKPSPSKRQSWFKRRFSRRDS